MLMCIALAVLFLSEHAAIVPMANSTSANDRPKHWILCFALLLCCLPKAPILLIALSTIVTTLSLMTNSENDCRYASKKFVVHMMLALVMLACASSTSFTDTISAILYILAYGILTVIYPFNGWFDTFCSRAMIWLTSIWLIVIRSCLAAHFFAKIHTLPNFSIPLIQAFAWLTLAFVPILFFAQTNVKRTASRMVCWQTGYLWLFASILPPDKIDIFTMMAISQGIFLSIVMEVAIYLHKNKHPLDGLFRTHYFFATFLTTSLVCLIVLLPIFLTKKGVPSISTNFKLAALATTIIPAIFLKKLYDIVK